MATEWKPSRLFPDYEISNDGRVRRLTRGGRRYPIGYELKAKPHQRGYLFYNLSRDGEEHTALAHRLVALEWLGEPPTPEHEVAHNDGSRTNNAVANLRWATLQENQDDRKRHGTYHCGELAASTKISDEAVQTIRAEYAANGDRYRGGAVTMQKLADKNGISIAQVSRIVNGRQRTTADQTAS